MPRAVLLLIGSVLFASNLQAQSWCPPGATWNFQLQAFATDGYFIRTYTGDAIIDGWIAQRIHVQGEQITYWPNSDTIQIDNTTFTSVQDSVLYERVLWNGVSAWDTLYRFDAVIGDRWFPPAADSVCMDGIAGMLEVVDTGSMVIDGLPLRTWELTYLDAAAQPTWSVQVVERLGYLGGLTILPGGCIIIEYGEFLRCYSDAQILYNAPSWPYGCNSVTGDVEPNEHPELALFPNPGADHFMLKAPPGVHQVEMLDVTGRCVLAEQLERGTERVDTSALPVGLYLIRVDGKGAIGRWVKH